MIHTSPEDNTPPQNGARPRDDSREASFRAAFDECYQPLLAFVLRRVPTPEQAQDVMADVFLAAWRRWDEIPRDDALRMWLYGTARLVVANHRRSYRRSSRLEERVFAMFETPAQDGVSVEDQADLEVAISALGRLSESDRELVLMSVWDDLSNAEIAQVLGVSRETVAVRLHRAKQRLREQFQLTMQSGDATGHVYDMNQARHAGEAGGR